MSRRPVGEGVTNGSKYRCTVGKRPSLMAQVMVFVYLRFLALQFKSLLNALPLVPRSMMAAPEDERMFPRRPPREGYAVSLKIRAKLPLDPALQSAQASILIFGASPVAGWTPPATNHRERPAQWRTVFPVWGES